MLKDMLSVSETLKWVFVMESIRWISYKYKVHVKPVYFDTVDLKISSSGKPICGWQVTKQLGPL